MVDSRAGKRLNLHVSSCRDNSLSAGVIWCETESDMHPAENPE
jgi:hypothetical protein